jgi:hypothetical protein
LNKQTVKEYTTVNATGKKSAEKTLSSAYDTHSKGGAIYAGNGVNLNITGSKFDKNSSYNGGAIYNIGTIGSITNMTISDTNTSDVMVATEGGGSIGTINNMTIKSSSGTGLSFYGATGETIKNSTFSNMYGHLNKMGYGLQVTTNPGATGIGSHIDTIDNIIVSENQTGGMRIDDNNSLAKPSNVGLIKNSQFLNNGTTGNNKAGGIWAKTDTLTISASHSENNDEKDENGKYIRRERRSSSYQRSFHVEGLKPEDIVAQYKNGVLTVNLPKKETIPEKEEAVRIEVKD